MLAQRTRHHLRVYHAGAQGREGTALVLEEVVHLLAPMGRRMPMHVVVVHVGVADAQAVDCFALLVTEGAVPPSDLDVVLILNPLSEAKKDSVADVRRSRGQTRRTSRL